MTINGNLPMYDAPTVVLTKAELDGFRERYEALLQADLKWREAVAAGIFGALVYGTAGADDNEWIQRYVMPKVRKWSAQLLREKGLLAEEQQDCRACEGTGNMKPWDDEACRNCKGHGVVERDGGPVYSERPKS